MKNPMNPIRTISTFALLLLATLTGCTDLRTKEPFGEIHPIAKNARQTFAGTWYSPTTRREHWNRFTVTINDDGNTGKMVMENAEGKTQTYELQFRKIETEVVFYRAENRPEEGWQFCWLGRALNTLDDKKDDDDTTTLALCIPHEKSFTKLGLKTEKRKVPAPPFGIQKKGPKENPATVLTESPEEITAKIKDVDFRTLLIPTMPIVLIRHDLIKLTAKPQEASQSK